jgi:hypothetical protein
MNNPEQERPIGENDKAKENLRKRLINVLETMDKAIEALPEGEAKRDMILARENFREFIDTQMEPLFDGIGSGFENLKGNNNA